MATKTETLLNAVKFNKLTRAQYDAAKATGQINENEFYMTGETLGEGDMLKSVYDKDNDGIVDNSKKVNGLTVETAVPKNAKFTDTTYGVVSTSANGLAPKLPGNTTTFLRGDGAWTAPSGQGDMTKAVYDTNGDGVVNKADVATSANKVASSLTVKLNSGTTEGTNLFTFNGSAAKSINITPSSIGAAASSHTHDDRYYTETETDTKLAAKANSSHTHTKSQITDFPAALKNPNALTISLNGTSQGAYDGSAAKAINITAAGVGALPKAAGSYSTSEVSTGKTWIDGKTIYRRVFKLTGQKLPQLNFTTYVPMSSFPDLDQFVNVTAMLYLEDPNATNGVPIMLPCALGDSAIIVQSASRGVELFRAKLSATGGSLYPTGNTNGLLFVVEYTKS